MIKVSTTGRLIQKEENAKELEEPAFLRHCKKPDNVFPLGLVGGLLLFIYLLKIKRIGFPSGNYKKNMLD